MTAREVVVIDGGRVVRARVRALHLRAERVARRCWHCAVVGLSECAQLGKRFEAERVSRPKPDRAVAAEAAVEARLPACQRR